MRKLRAFFNPNQKGSVWEYEAFTITFICALRALTLYALFTVLCFTGYYFTANCETTLDLIFCTSRQKSFCLDDWHSLGCAMHGFVGVIIFLLYGAIPYLALGFCLFVVLPECHRRYCAFEVKEE